MIIGEQLRAIRDMAGLSLSQLAAKIPYSRAALGHYETGTRPTPPEVICWYETALGVGLDTVTAVAALGRAEVDRRAFLAGLTYSVAASAVPLAVATSGARVEAASAGRTVGAAEIEDVRDITAAMVRLDERSGGAAGRTALAEFLATDIATYCRARFTTDVVRRQMYGAAAEAVYLAGWKAHDLDQDAVAQRYFLAAFDLAAEADPHGHAGYILRILAHQAMDLDKPTHCVPLAEEAQRRLGSRAGADTRALFAATVARAHATLGNRTQALAAVRTTEQLLDHADGEPQPRWAGLWGPAVAQAHSHCGKTLHELGDYDGAHEKFMQAASFWDTTTHPRVYAVVMGYGANALQAKGDIGGACDIWAQLLPLLDTVQSDRVDKIKTNARRALAA